MSPQVIAAAVAGCIFVLIVIVFMRRGAHYRRTFSEAHFDEVYHRFVTALDNACAHSGSSFTSDHDASTFTSSEGLIIAVTCDREGANYQYHISISQAPVTTKAVANRFAFFIVTVLNRNQCSLSPFFTQTNVHHLIFSMSAKPPLKREFGEVYAQYLSSYQPLPFQFQHIDGIPTR